MLPFRRCTFNYYARAFARVRENARRKLGDYLKFRDEKRYTFASDIKRPLLKRETFRRGERPESERLIFMTRDHIARWGGD